MDAGHPTCRSGELLQEVGSRIPRGGRHLGVPSVLTASASCSPISHRTDESHMYSYRTRFAAATAVLLVGGLAACSSNASNSQSGTPGAAGTASGAGKSPSG